VCYLISVPRDKTLIDLIAALPDDELASMRQRNARELLRARTEVLRLELQEQQFALAVAKRERKKPGRPGSLTPDLVMDAARATEPPMSAKEVQETLALRGLGVSVNAVRNHLNKLVKDGDLEKDEFGYNIPTRPQFVPAGEAEDFASSAANDDIPF
jgi:hypothetical protein